MHIYSLFAYSCAKFFLFKNCICLYVVAPGSYDTSFVSSGTPVTLCFSALAKLHLIILYQHVLVPNSSTLEEALNEFHALKDLLFLEAFPNDLHANGQAMHVVGIVALEGIPLDLVPRPERGRNYVELAVDARNGQDARGIVKLEKKN